MVSVIVYGVGAIGAQIARYAIQKGYSVVGAVDQAPEKVGRDIGDLLGLGPMGVKVEGELGDEVADVVLHATTSHLVDAQEQILGIVRKGMNVVSTCEELSYPFLDRPDESSAINRLATERGVTVLGTGVNPGFLMDTLPIALTSLCQRVDEIKVERVIDASTRRMGFQKKIGAGLSLDEFGKVGGHVGLRESAAMIAHALHWDLNEITGEKEPILSQRESGQSDQVVGMRDIAKGWLNGKAVITLEFSASVEERDPHDQITIKGVPPIKMRGDCVHGDLATVAVAVNVIPRVISARPGLLTMADLPV